MKKKTLDRANECFSPMTAIQRPEHGGTRKDWANQFEYKKLSMRNSAALYELPFWR